MNKDYIAGSLDNIGFVAMAVKYKGKWVLSFTNHPQIKTWDCPGGHVEKDEEALKAAKRELYEETGAIDYDIIPVWDYQAFKEDGTFVNNGRYYFVNIREFAHIPDGSEMNKIDFFDVFPENFRYPDNSEEIFENFKRAEKYALAYYK